MAEIRKLWTAEQKRRIKAGQLKPDEKPKGKWQATVRQPGGTKRWSKSDQLRTVVKTWADDQETAMRRGEFIDPNAGKMTLAVWWEKWNKTRRVEIATAEKNDGWWRNHIEPQFGTWPLSQIQSWDVEEWVTDLADDTGPTTVASSLRLLRQVLGEASRHKLIGANPAAGVKATPPPPHVDRFLSREEADRLLDQFTGQDRVFVELMLYCGLRFQEAAGLRRFRVDLLRKRIQIAKVMPRKGGEKKPKTDAGVRPVPLTEELVTALSKLIPIPDNELVFTTERGSKPLRYANWLRRVWHPAIYGAPAVEARPAVRGHAPTPAVPARAGAGLADPQPTPHDLRHTYGSWLGEKGVPPAQIAALMGHAGLRSVERYIHATEARFDQARDALKDTGKKERRVSGETAERRVTP